MQSALCASSDYMHICLSFCVLLLSFCVKAAWGDWKDHEAGQYKEIRDCPRKVIEMLTAAGQFFYQQSILH